MEKPEIPARLPVMLVLGHGLEATDQVCECSRSRSRIESRCIVIDCTRHAFAVNWKEALWSFEAHSTLSVCCLWRRAGRTLSCLHSLSAKCTRLTSSLGVAAKFIASSEMGAMARMSSESLLLRGCADHLAFAYTANKWRNGKGHLFTVCTASRS